MNEDHIILIRHGMVPGNLAHRYVGKTDESILPAQAQRISACRHLYPKAEFIFTSPMKRCLETAQILFPDCMRKGQYAVVSDFRECDFGDFEYKNYQEIMADPQSAAAYQNFIDTNGESGFPGGETKRAFIARTAEAFRRVCIERKTKAEDTKTTRGSSIVICAHGGTVMAILDAFSSPRREYYSWQVGNAEGFMAKLRWINADKNIFCLREIQRLP